jgi:hypothetical protein
VYHVYSLQKQDKIAAFGVSILWPPHCTLCAGVEEFFEYVLFFKILSQTNKSVNNDRQAQLTWHTSSGHPVLFLRGIMTLAIPSFVG